MFTFTDAVELSSFWGRNINDIILFLSITVFYTEND